MDATSILREHLTPYAFQDSFSFAFNSKPADRQCEIKNGRTVGVVLTPARCTLAMSFDGRSGVRVSLKIEEATIEALVETVIVTVQTLLKPRAPPNPPALHTPERP